MSNTFGLISLIIVFKKHDNLKHPSRNTLSRQIKKIFFQFEVFYWQEKQFEVLADRKAVSARLSNFVSNVVPPDNVVMVDKK